MGSLGSMEILLKYHIPNATKCLTWKAVKNTHLAQQENDVMKLKDTYGLLIFLALGLSGAMMFIFIEYVIKNPIMKAQDIYIRFK